MLGVGYIDAICSAQNREKTILRGACNSLYYNEFICLLIFVVAIIPYHAYTLREESRKIDFARIDFCGAWRDCKCQIS